MRIRLQCTQLALDWLNLRLVFISLSNQYLYKSWISRLIHLLIGHKTDFIVNTCSAGCGTLAVTIDGELLASKGVTETSSVMVETVTKMSKKSSQVSLPVFKSDASKVTSKGMGLKKAYMNKQNTFSISASDAGTLLNCDTCP